MRDGFYGVDVRFFLRTRFTLRLPLCSHLIHSFILQKMKMPLAASVADDFFLHSIPFASLRYSVDAPKPSEYGFSFFRRAVNVLRCDYDTRKKFLRKFECIQEQIAAKSFAAYDSSSERSISTDTAMRSMSKTQKLPKESWESTGGITDDGSRLARVLESE